MSPISPLSVLAFASAAVAVPFHGHLHNHYSRAASSQAGPYSFAYAQPSSSSPVVPVSGTGTGAPFPVPSANATGTHPTASGIPTGYATGIPSNYAPSPVGPATESISSPASSSCATDVTVTSKVQVTVTVTAGESSTTSAVNVSPTAGSSSSTHIQSTVHVTATTTVSAYSAPYYSVPASSSSEAAPVSESTSSSAYTASASGISAPLSYGSVPLTYSAAPSSSSAVVSPPASSTSSAEVSSVASSSSSAATTSATSSPIYIAPTLTYSEANKGVAAASSAASAATSTKGKRGLAYNDASLTDCFVNSDQVSWAYNWGSATSGLSDSVNYVPMLWGPASDFTNNWSENAKAAVKGGASHLMGFNEPDLSTQSNLSPAAAADAWRTYMQPFAGGSTKLVSPSVTNGGGAMGLTWLSEFLSACSDCQIDAVNIHWYDSAANTEYFKSHVQNATEIAGGKPVFLTEFGATGSDDEINTFLQDVMPWMDSKDFVHGYAYFMVASDVLVSGGEPSTIGSTFKSYTA